MSSHTSFEQQLLCLWVLSARPIQMVWRWCMGCTDVHAACAITTFSLFWRDMHVCTHRGCSVFGTAAVLIWGSALGSLAVMHGAHHVPACSAACAVTVARHSTDQPQISRLWCPDILSEACEGCTLCTPGRRKAPCGAPCADARGPCADAPGRCAVAPIAISILDS